MLRFSAACIAFFTFLIPAFAADEAIPPRILEVRPIAGVVRPYSTFEAVIELEADYENPFDTTEIQVNAQIRNSVGDTSTVGGFYYQKFDAKLDENGMERLAPAAEPEWRIRFTPTQPDRYTYIVTITTRAGRTFSRQMSFRCEGAPNDFERDGFVRNISGRYLRYDSGKPFFGIGENLAWSRGGGIHDYDQWLDKLAAGGANFVRIWFWRNPAFDLELMPQPDEGSGVGKYDLGNAWRLDYVLNRCEKLGIKVMLCLFDFHPLTRNFDWFGTTYHPWDNCVYNTVNGGMLYDPSDFFSDERAIAAQRQFTRYVISRYGSSTAIMSWELFNEVDLAPGFRYQFNDVLDWHSRMGEFIKYLDPYSRPVTTSYCESYCKSDLWMNDVIDIVQTHSYDEKDMAAVVPEFIESSAKTGKPHIIGEIGNNVNLTADKEGDDPTALHLHNALWAAMTSGSASGPLTWWWDSYIHPRDLYSVFTAPAAFAETIPWCDDMRPTPAEVMPLEGIVQKDVKVNGFIHGEMHKNDLGEGPTFEVDYAFDGTFGIHIKNVAAGGELKIYIDDERVLREKLPASRAEGDWKDLIWHRDYSYWEAIYDKTFTIDVPAGQHSIKVRNDGIDWISFSKIELTNYAEQDETVTIETDGEWKPQTFARYAIEPNGDISAIRQVPLRALAMTGGSVSIAWVQNAGNTWFKRKDDAPAPEAARGTVIFPELGSGTYAVQQWNTFYDGQNGQAVEDEFIVDVTEGEVLHIQTPPISTDVAYRIWKLDKP